MKLKVNTEKWQSHIFQETYGFANFGQKGPTNRVFALWAMKYLFVVSSFFENCMSEKNLVLELLTEMLSPNQIAQFFKF